MTKNRKNDFGEWHFLNVEGRRRLFKREELLHAVPGEINWRWNATPFNRVALMNLLAFHMPNSRYLEIGCDRNELFDALLIEDKTGVDPVSGGNQRMTSDAFFSKNERQFDLIFIDGLHVHEQVHRDVTNALDALAPGGWIGLHDLLPSNWQEQHVPRVQGSWTGDVWKIAFELSRTRGIDFKIIQIDHGVGLVQKTGPTKPELVDLVEELEAKGFGYFYENHHSLPVIDWTDARNWIAETFRARYGKSPL